ncbi:MULTISPECIES: hypothetical protein [Aequorivita]|uniref:Response regulator transcription factor n=1 Tax=Aequorivita iocasae TaxID=2803865 RepID=A0ABX7DTC5_9FLAO|nr:MULTISPECIES: hypothetical protein [Aequorivita]QQX76024.1 hypothetical protein JK629_11850 [Aequorivita iocasae]UCA55484.1 hypothetical protein LDL78_11905 [Aequorivita sp. F7]
MKKRIKKYLLLEQLPSLRQLILDVFEEMGEKMGVKFEPFIISPSIASAGNLHKVLGENNFEFVIFNLDFPFATYTDFKCPKDFLIYLDLKYPIPKKLVIIPHTTVFQILQLSNLVSIDGFMDALDCNAETLRLAVQQLTDYSIFYSRTVIQLITKYIYNEDILGQQDYLILNELSKGTPLNKIPKKLFISRTTIQRRRTKMKEFFKVEGLPDSELVKRAQQERFV